ncbi:MAG: sigma-70 family RNA polymerase sigma factor [Candidatus Magnetomorum sp.]|nr:sigma-70 family RNA polymerase sigma factor [Candidatus Magnetomorum sp.]
MNNDKDKQFIEKCVKPCQKECLVQQYWNLVYYTIRKTFTIYNVHQVNDDIDALRNEVFIQLFRGNCRKLKQYRPDLGTGLEAWVKLITSRIVQNFLKKKDPLTIGRRNHLISIDDQDTFTELPDSETKKQTLAKEHKHQMIINAMKSLKPKDQLILQLYYYDGFSMDDIAIIMKISRGAADTRKSRAIERLKEVIHS